MNSGRCDASTSTDDVKSRPLCLFYFTHPFGVLSPEPPTLATAPAHIARAFVNMEPVPPFHLWSVPSEDDYNSASSSSRPSYELGSATVHRAPVSLAGAGGPRARRCTLELGAARDTFSSSLFSSDMWFNSSSSCRSTDYPRRLIPYNKILPPLQLPSPKDSSNLSSSDDFWPKKCLNPEKFSLPPIELPSVKVKVMRSKKCSLSSEEVSSVESAALKPARARRLLGVSKTRRARPADLRRLLSTLMRRVLAVLYSEQCSAGGMGYVLERVPVVHRCCGLPLRAAALCVALLGLAAAAGYLFLFSAAGAHWVRALGGAGGVTDALRYVHGVIGVLLTAVHALLLLGAAYESDTLCEVYLWGAVVCCAGAVGSSATLAGAAAVEAHALAALAVLCAALLGLVVCFYCVVVVANYKMTMP